MQRGVFCWTINQFISEAIQLMPFWGLRYSFTMTWVKNDAIQIPNRPRYNSEFVIVGRRGNPRFQEIKSFQMANCWRQRGHSEKPEEFYDLLRRVTPGPRLDVFGRRRIAGFESWGDEAPKGEALPDHYQTVLTEVVA